LKTIKKRARTKPAEEIHQRKPDDNIVKFMKQISFFIIRQIDYTDLIDRRNRSNQILQTLLTFITNRIQPRQQPYSLILWKPPS